MTRALPVLAVIAGVLAVSPTAQTADDSEERARTCVVFSGGGARGAAHIGILKTLEDLRVPVDCVVGTSMGAVVGGLYASGLSPSSLESIFLQADWRDLLNDRPPRRNIPFRRKQDDDLSLFQFEFGLGRKGIILPSGLIAGQKLDFLLKSLTLPVAEVRDFDDLPIPFRAVATDLETGEMIVLDHGNLAEVMQASMAVPGAFTPAELEGRTLVDGGLVRNLPVDIARQLGASRVVAVDVTSPLVSGDAGQSVVSVAVSMVDLFTDKNVREQKALLGPEDVLIVPDLGEVGGSDFEEVPEAIAFGERAAWQVEEDLSRMSVSGEAYALHLERREAREAAGDEPVQIDEVRVTGVQRVNPRIVASRVESKPGQPLDMELLRRDLERVYELGDFERVDFRIEREEGRNVLAIDAREKSWGPNFLRLGLDLEADFEGQGEFTVLADLRRARVNRMGAELKGLVTVGEENTIFAEFYQPLGFSGIWFVAPQVELRRVRDDVFNEDGTISPFRVRTGTGRIDIGAQFRKYGEIRTGILRGRATAELLDDTAAFEPLEIDTGGWIGSLTIDRLDNANFPRSGTFGEADLFLAREGLGAEVSYDRFETRLIRADSFGSHTVVGTVRYGSGLGSTIPFYDEFALGGFLNLSGFRSRQLRGQVVGFAQIVYFTQVGRLPGGLGEGFYLGGSLEVGNVWQDTSEVEFGDLRPAAAVFAGLDTVFGPLYLGYGRADGSENSFYLFLGQSF